MTRTTAYVGDAVAVAFQVLTRSDRQWKVPSAGKDLRQCAHVTQDQEGC